VVAERAPGAIRCADAFHALDEVRRQAWNEARGAVNQRRAGAGPPDGPGRSSGPATPCGRTPRTSPTGSGRSWPGSPRPIPPAPGLPPQKKASAWTSSSRAKPAKTPSAAGSAGPAAAASPPSWPSSDGSSNTGPPSTPLWTPTCPTPSSSPPTPRSVSSPVSPSASTAPNPSSPSPCSASAATPNPPRPELTHGSVRRASIVRRARHACVRRGWGRGIGASEHQSEGPRPSPTLARRTRWSAGDALPHHTATSATSVGTPIGRTRTRCRNRSR